MLSLIYHDSYQDYFFGPEHPFRPIRQAMALDLLATLGHAPERLTPPPATRVEVTTIHDEALVECVEAASRDGTAPPDARRFGLGTTDTPTFEGIDASTRRLVGGTLHAARLISSGEARRVLQFGGGLHHAHRDRAAGFCVYNDLAVAIHFLLEKGLRVAYVDVDVHHGDGVQSIFYETPDILTLSLHETGRTLYPGTGAIDELGAGGGRGLKLNVPLQPGTTDASYMEAFDQVAEHALSWFGPDVLVVQCGADAHRSDPLAHLRLTTHAYEHLFRRLMELADQYAGGRILCTLGGGYDLDATPRVWTLLYLVLAGIPLPEALPDDWVERWSKRLRRSLTYTLHDDTPEDEEETLQKQNRTTCRHLLNAAAKCWR